MFDTLRLSNFPTKGFALRGRKVRTKLQKLFIVLAAALVQIRAAVRDIPPALYRRRDLSLFVVSRFVANCAMQIQSVAIGWQIYDMVRTPLALGLVGLCQFVPMFLLTLPAGDLADRFDQRRVYALAAGLQAACSALFLGLTLLAPHKAWLFYLVLILFGAARGFAGPSGQSLLPFLVEQERLPRAISHQFFRLHRRRDRGARTGRLSVCAWARRRSTRSASQALSWPPSSSRAWAGGVRFRNHACERFRARRRRRAFCALASGGAGRDFAGSVCGAARRRHGSVAGLCPRYPACRPDRAGISEKRARRRCLRRRLRAHPPPDRGPGGRQDVRRRRHLRHRHHRLRPVHLVSAFARRRCSCWAPATW